MVQEENQTEKHQSGKKVALGIIGFIVGFIALLLIVKMLID